MHSVTLYHLECYHCPSGHTHRWHLSRPPGYQSRSDDMPGSVPYLPLVAGRSDAMVQLKALGGERDTKVSVADMRLMNTLPAAADYSHAVVYDVTAGVLLRRPLLTRPLDLLLTEYVVREVVELRLVAGAPLASAVVVWRSRTGVPKPRRAEIALPLYDARLDFDKPVLTERYAGTGGYEGPAELRGVTKERSFGLAPWVKPTYLGVIEGLHRWGTNGGRRITAVPTARQMAVPLTLVAGPAVTAGQYSVDVATGVVTTSEKYSDLRCVVHGDSPGWVWRRHIGALIAGLAVDAGLVSSVDCAMMDAVPRTVGTYLPAGDSTTYRALMDKWCASVPRGGWYHDLAVAGRLVVTRLPDPAAVVPVRRYRRSAGTMGMLTPVDGAALVPAKQVTLRWSQNPGATDQTSPSASAGDAALWGQEWRELPSSVVGWVADAWGAAARVEPVDTAISLEADALAELPLWLAELSSPPALWEIPVYDGAPGVWIGSAVTVQDEGVTGFADDVPVIVWGRTAPSASGRCTLYVAR